MARSTRAQKSRLLNVAYQLLARGERPAQAARSLSRDYGLSSRQAYRYLEQAGRLGHPVPVEEDSVPFTLTLPTSTARQLRSYAAKSGLTHKEVVTRALRAFLGMPRGQD
jgi:predicted DNA-binding transcriptional regulator YafY